jgi:hypothetical protein
MINQEQIKFVICSSSAAVISFYLSDRKSLYLNYINSLIIPFIIRIFKGKPRTSVMPQLTVFDHTNDDKEQNPDLDDMVANGLKYINIDATTLRRYYDLIQKHLINGNHQRFETCKKRLVDKLDGLSLKNIYLLDGRGDPYIIYEIDDITYQRIDFGRYQSVYGEFETLMEATL